MDGATPRQAKRLDRVNPLVRPPERVMQRARNGSSGRHPGAISVSLEITFEHTFRRNHNMRRVSLVVVGMGMVVGCARHDDAPKQASSERERDSVLGGSSLPGAS